PPGRPRAGDDRPDRVERADRGARSRSRHSDAADHGREFCLVLLDPGHAAVCARAGGSLGPDGGVLTRRGVPDHFLGNFTQVVTPGLFHPVISTWGIILNCRGGSHFYCREMDARASDRALGGASQSSGQEMSQEVHASSGTPQRGLKIGNPRDFYGGLALVLLGFLALWASRDLAGMHGISFGPGTAPRMFASILIVLGVAIMAVGCF